MKFQVRDFFFLFYGYLKEMNSPVGGSSWSNLMRDGSDFNDQSSFIFELWNKYHKSKNELDQVNDLCQSFTQIEQSINSNTTVEDLTQICKEHQSQKWVGEFTKILPKCIKDPMTTILDPEKASESLTACFDKSFWNSFGIQILEFTHYIH